MPSLSLGCRAIPGINLTFKTNFMLTINQAIKKVGDSSNIKKVDPVELVKQGLTRFSIWKNPFGQVMMGMSDGKDIAKIRVKYPHADVPTTKEQLIAYCKHQFNTFQLYLGMADSGNTYFTMGKLAPDFSGVEATVEEIFGAVRIASNEPVTA